MANKRVLFRPLGETKLVDVTSVAFDFASDRVDFDVRIRTTLPIVRVEFHVMRRHEEFVWLNGRKEKSESYADHIECSPLCPSLFEYKPIRKTAQRLKYKERDKYDKTGEIINEYVECKLSRLIWCG